MELHEAREVIEGFATATEAEEAGGYMDMISWGRQYYLPNGQKAVADYEGHGCLGSIPFHWKEWELEPLQAEVERVLRNISTGLLRPKGGKDILSILEGMNAAFKVGFLLGRELIEPPANWEKTRRRRRQLEEHLRRVLRWCERRGLVNNARALLDDVEDAIRGWDVRSIASDRVGPAFRR